MSNQKKSATEIESESGSRETRERILAAAYTVLAEKGYDDATLKEIARAADAAPGLVHYYFGGKDQMLVEVLRAIGDRLTSATQQLIQSMPQEQLADAALRLPFERVVREPEWYRLRYELFALGLHNATLAPGVKTLLAEGRKSLSVTIERILGEIAAEPATLASILLACFDGLALQKLMDPELDLDAMYDALTRMVHSLQSSAG